MKIQCEKCGSTIDVEEVKYKGRSLLLCRDCREGRRVTVRDLLNEIRWDKRHDPESYSVIFIHRTDEGNLKEIPYTSISEISGGFFTYSYMGDEAIIPLHRVIQIKNTKTGDKLIDRKSRYQTE
ncbi:MAG: RNA repair domain-containing protein [Candidatus Jordarchaeum sp.]|uniref:RNA repair domain-containing protein n=1 Tax=Candidatus Jordarchaeum sp. TaxID=2823881 RepID=UPI004048F71E